MAVLIETAKATNANSYLSVLRGNAILGLRLYTTKWDDAGLTPNADGYLVNGGATTGSTTIAVDTGTGTFTATSEVQFASHSTIYAVSTALSAAGNLVITTGLTEAVADDEVVSRITAYEKEKALVWATTLLDSVMIWNGTQRTTTQRLGWPRSGVVDPAGNSYDYDTIPELLEIGTAELALVLLERNKFALPGILGQGLKEAKLGPMTVKVDSTQQEDVIPQNILAILSPLGHLEPEADVGSRVMALWRA